MTGIADGAAAAVLCVTTLVGACWLAGWLTDNHPMVAAVVAAVVFIALPSAWLLLRLNGFFR